MSDKKNIDKMLNVVLAQLNTKKKGQDPDKIRIGILDKIEALDVEATSSGSLSLDLALGVGGYPNGRIIEIFGPESSGKTTLALHAIAEAQKKGNYAAFIDAENALDPVYARNLGVDTHRLIFSQPDSGNEGMRMVQKLVRSGTCDVIVVDSVAALTTEQEIEGDIDKSHVGQQARLMSQSLKLLVNDCRQSKTTVIFTNQIRMKVGVLYGSPETTPGGEALKFYASQRLNVRRKEPLKEGQEVIGARTRVKVMKNKVGPPFKTAEFDIIYGKGIDKEKDIISVAAEAGIITRSGAWYSYKDENIGQGLDNTIDFILSNPELMKEIIIETRQALLTKPELENVSEDDVSD